MDRTGTRIVVPRRDPAVKEEPFLDFEAGYVQRAIADLPRQGDRYPWKMSMSYADDVKLVRGGPVVDEALRFSTASPARATTDSTEAVPA